MVIIYARKRDSSIKLWTGMFFEFQLQLEKLWQKLDLLPGHFQYPHIG